MKLINLLPLKAPPTLHTESGAEAYAYLQQWHVDVLINTTAQKIDNHISVWALNDQTAQQQYIPILPIDTVAEQLPHTVAVLLPDNQGYALLSSTDTTQAPKALAQAVWQQLQPYQALLNDIALQVAHLGRGQMALVGGAVRDILLGLEASQDLDVVITGQPVAPLAQALAASWKRNFDLSLTIHTAYDNATLHLTPPHLSTAQTLTLDLIATRLERYPLPGAAPQTHPATLSQDLLRRDFSVNALALVITPHEVHLYDPTGGLADLQARVLRPLHAHSFTEDASRLIRGARLAARLGLVAHPDVLAQVNMALSLAPHTPRLWAELRLCLSEPQPGKVLTLLKQWGAGKLLPPKSAALLTTLDTLSTRPTDGVYGAALLSLAPSPTHLALQLGLGKRSLELLARVHSNKTFGAATPEQQLRRVLYPATTTSPSYPPLTGRDLLALGFPAGPLIGQALAYLTQEHTTAQWHSREDEQQAALSWLSERQ